MSSEDKTVCPRCNGDRGNAGGACCEWCGGTGVRPLPLPLTLPPDMRDRLRARVQVGLGACSVPDGLHEGLERYVCDGIPTGSFLEAVLCNDLKEAFARADVFNRHRLFEIVDFLYNYTPAECWGSEWKVQRWLAMEQLRSR